MKKLLTLIKGDSVHLASSKRILPSKEFSKLVNANDVLKKVKADSEKYRLEVAKELEALKEAAQKEGYLAGHQEWNDQIAFLENEAKAIRKETEEAIVPLALTAVKKIIGKEIELKPETIVEIVSTALKAVSQHHRITVYVNKTDLEIVEAHRNRLKEIFDHLQTLIISARDDVEKGGCIIETEKGILNAQLTNQLDALEQAFHRFFQTRAKEKS